MGVLIAVAVSASLAAPALAQSARADEYRAKAAFLFKFVKFVQWPPSPYRPDANTVVIGIVGRTAFNDAFEAVAREKALSGPHIIVRQLNREDDPRTYHIVFIPQSETHRTAEILQSARDAAVLTVGETVSFLAEGGIARFYIEGDRVRFEIDGRGAQHAGLKISSQLLSLAKQ